MTPVLHHPPVISRVGSALAGLAMWALWIWMILPQPVSEELRHRIVETSLGPTLRIVGALVVTYVIAVVGCHWRSTRCPRS